MGLLAEDVLNLCRLNRLPHEVLEVEATVGPLGPAARLSFDRAVLHAAEKLANYRERLAAEGMGNISVGGEAMVTRAAPGER